MKLSSSRKNWLNKSEYRWKIQLSGSGLAPDIVENEDAMLQKVISTSGAIGFVSESKVTNDVKVLYVIK